MGGVKSTSNIARPALTETSFHEDRENRLSGSGSGKSTAPRDVARTSSQDPGKSNQGDAITRSDLDFAVAKIEKVLYNKNISGEKGALAAMLSWFTVETRDTQRVLKDIRTEQEVIKAQMKMLMEDRQGGGKVELRNVERSRPVNGIIPLNNKKEFQELQAQLTKNSTLEEELINELHTAGGSSGVECLKLMVRKIFSKEFSKQVTFNGRGENLALQNTPIGRLIIEASKTCKHPLSEKEIMLITGEILRREKDSGKGSKSVDSTMN